MGFETAAFLCNNWEKEQPVGDFVMFSARLFFGMINKKIV